MGNRTSKSSSTGKNKTISNSQTLDNSNQNNLDISFKSLNNSIEDTSTYNGIISTNKQNNKNQQSDINNSDLLTQEKTNSDINSKLTYTIRWKEECNEVLITGNFCNWKDTFKMKKNSKNNFFEKEIPLINIPKERCEFKFIVDGTWKISDNYPSDKDQNGYTNNYLDSNYINAHISELNSGNNNINSLLLNKSKDNSTDTKKSSYGTAYPTEDQFNQEAPKMPEVFDISIQLDDFTKQEIIGNDDYLSFTQINFDSSYKSIFLPAHSYINHLLTKRKIIKTKKRKKKENNIENNFENDDLNMNYIRINCNAKFKSKCLSIIYYSPYDKDKDDLLD